MVSNFFKKRFEDYYNLVNDFFTEKITDPQLLSEYHKESLSRRIETIRLGHIFALLIFLVFGFFDYFTIIDRSLLQHLTIIRLAIALLVMIPFYLFSYYSNFKKYIRVSLFFTYLVFGSYLVYTSYLLNDDNISFLHNYLGLNLTIVALFIILTYRVKDTLILAILLILGYNLINYISVDKEVFFFDGEFNLRHFIDINVWLFVVTFLGYILWLYSEQNSKENFLIQRDLQVQKDELRKANSVKNKFFSLVSHDLKNLISSQYSLSSYMANKYDAMAEPKRKEFLNMIEDSTKQTLNIFEELMMWMHTQTNRVTIDIQRRSLKKLINETLDVLELSVVNKKLKLVKLTKLDELVLCDENSIKTVIRNVLGNAIKFSHTGHRIEIKATRIDAFIELTIIDYGVGISKEAVDTLFQLDCHYSEEGTEGESGTGLGLILCKELMVLNKGDIKIESELGKGTIVSIYLPCA